MVKFFYESAIPKALRYAYDKSLWVKIKTLHAALKEHNPTLAYFVAPAVPILLIAGGVVGYFKYHCDNRPKYYEHYCIMRPDDPRVKNIRHDHCLRMAEPFFQGQMTTAR